MLSRIATVLVDLMWLKKNFNIRGAEQRRGRKAYFEAAGHKNKPEQSGLCNTTEKPNRSPAAAGPVWKGGAAT